MPNQYALSDVAEIQQIACIEGLQKQSLHS